MSFRWYQLHEFDNDVDRHYSATSMSRDEQLRCEIAGGIYSRQIRIFGWICDVEEFGE